MPTQYTYEQLKSNWASWIVAFTSSLPTWLLAKTKFKVTNDLPCYGCHQPRGHAWHLLLLSQIKKCSWHFFQPS